MEHYTKEEKEAQRQKKIFDLVFVLLRNDIKSEDYKLVARKIFSRYKDKLKFDDTLSPDNIIEDYKSNIKALIEVMSKGSDMALGMLEEHIKNHPRNPSAFSRKTDSLKTKQFISSLTEELYTKTDAANFLNKGRKTIHNWIESGKMKQEETTGNQCIPKSEIIRIYRIEND